MSRGLTRRMVVASSLLAILLSTAFAVLLLAISSLRDSSALILQTREELVSAEELEKLVIDLETGVRGYVITREPRFLEPWNRGRAAFPEQGTTLQRLVAGDALGSQRIRRIVAAVRSYIRDYATPLVAAAQRDEASARGVAVTAEGKQRVDALRAMFGQFRSTERSILAARQADADADTHRAIVAAAIGVGGSGALILLFTAYLTRVIVRPVRRAAAMADRVAGGDLTARIPERGVAEIGALERSFNTMAGSLESGREELAASRTRIVAAADETRRQIERDLHDGTQQRVISVGLDLRVAQAAVPPELPELRAEIGRAVEELSGVIADLREIARGIHPAILSEGGLALALRTLARRSAIPVELEDSNDERLPEPVEVAAYYVVSEALTNATKHAGASIVHVVVEHRDGALHLSIRDDGAGGADPSRGSGLTGIRDRVESLGGSIAVTTSLGEGTQIVVELPLPPG